MKQLVAVVFVGGLVSIPLIALAQSSSITLTWDNPTTHEDGSPLAPDELKEIELNDKRVRVKAVPFPTNIAVVYPGSAAHVWEVVAIDKKGNRSKYSNAVQWYPTPVPTIQWPPNNPSSLRVK